MIMFAQQQPPTNSAPHSTSFPRAVMGEQASEPRVVVQHCIKAEVGDSNPSAIEIASSVSLLPKLNPRFTVTVRRAVG
jgi:hypothetical protein